MKVVSSPMPNLCGCLLLLRLKSFLKSRDRMILFCIFSLFLLTGCVSVERPYVNPNRLSVTHNQGMRW